MVFKTDLAIDPLALQVGEVLSKAQATLVTAESCTGGGIAEAITRVSGSSLWFDCGFVTYSNASKRRLLNVSTASLTNHGAVSIPVVSEMADGALANSNATCSVAVSGVAGPTGGSVEKPVGFICFAWQIRGVEQPPVTFQTVLDGDRALIRQKAVSIGLQGLLGLFKAPSSQKNNPRKR